MNSSGIEEGHSEHAVIVYLRLRESFGSCEERDAISALEGALEQVIESASVGEFDGSEFGGGQCVLYMYGPDADQLFATVERVLRTSYVTKGGYAIKRYGDVEALSAVESKVNL
jgi:hypothetical protein